MTIFITALKNIKKDFSLNVISILQLTATLVMTLFMLSSILIRLQYYVPFSDYFEANGLLCVFSSVANSKLYDGAPLDKFVPGSELSDYLHSSINIAACNQVFCTLTNQPECQFNAISYNDEIINRFKPALSSGRWLNNSSNATEIEAVITENKYGWKVGDRIEISYFNIPNSLEIPVKIVGELKKDTKIPGGFSPRTGSENFTSFYSTYSFDVEEKPLIIFSADYLSIIDKDNKIVQGAFSNVLITYPDDFSDEKLLEEQQILSEMGCISAISLEKMKPNNTKYLFEQMYTLLPIIGALFVMVIVCGISISALSTKRRLKDYAIYSICGMQWKKISLVNLVQAIIIVTFSNIFAICCLCVLKHISDSVKIKIELSSASIIAACTICICYLAISMLMPIILAHSYTPKQLLSR